MKIAVYGRVFSIQAKEEIRSLFDELTEKKITALVYEPFYSQCRDQIELGPGFKTFNKYEDLKNQVDFVISIGGDGTLLDTLSFVGNSEIPVLGINTGRLGFLTSTTKDQVKQALSDLMFNRYSLDQRSVLLLESDVPLFQGMQYALNDLVIHKRDSSSMITVHTFINGEFLNSYWSDGLIVSTPTGSTGYSLSCGGPILFPQSASFAITPIAPHNLNVRPLVVSDENIISFEIEGRGASFLVSMDSRSESINSSIQLAVRKADFNFNLVRLNNENYLHTLRKKLMWGLDNRN